MRLNDEVRAFWEQEPCGTSTVNVPGHTRGTREWFAEIEAHRYAVEPMIHAVAQFTRHRGKKLLEIGVGAGTDHLQWARAGCECHGVDLTDAAIETTRQHLAWHGFQSALQRIDAERLPFPDTSFDLVYSWGVIHHSEKPEAIIGELHRVLRPGGMFIGMLYHRHSPLVLKRWIKHALLIARPWRSLRDVVWHHVESPGTKAYTIGEVQHMFAAFSEVSARAYLTPYDTQKWPNWLIRFFPDAWGWFIGIRAVK